MQEININKARQKAVGADTIEKTRESDPLIFFKYLKVW